jgi:hypothetical protein
MSTPVRLNAREQLPPELNRGRKRRMDRFDFWLFLSVWLVITAVAGLAIVYN